VEIRVNTAPATKAIDEISKSVPPVVVTVTGNTAEVDKSIDALAKDIEKAAPIVEVKANSKEFEATVDEIGKKKIEPLEVAANAESAKKTLDEVGKTKSTAVVTLVADSSAAKKTIDAVEKTKPVASVAPKSKAIVEIRVNTAPATKAIDEISKSVPPVVVTVTGNTAEVDKSIDAIKGESPSVDLKVAIDTDSAIKAVDGLESVHLPDVELDLDHKAITEGTSQAAGELHKYGEAARESTQEAEGHLRSYASVAGELFHRTGEEAVKGAERFDAIRSAASGIVSPIVQVYGAVRQAASTTSAAIDGIGNAAETISKVGSEGFAGFEKATDASIVAAGRTYDSVHELAEVYEKQLPAGIAASFSAFRALAANIGGFGTILAAARGSAAATAVAVGSIGSAIASAATAIGVYAGVVAVARAASEGLSDEAKQYVERASQVVGATAGAMAAARASAASYRLVATALYSSSTATEFFQRLFSGVASTFTRVASSAVSVVSRLTQVQSILKLVGAASDEKTTAAGFAALAARVAVTSAVFGGLAGAVGAFSAGTSVATGVIGGATAAVSGLAVTFPLAATFAAAAAVATGKFADELKELSEQSRQVAQLADRFGATTQEMERLQLAASATGVGLHQLGKGQQAFFTSLSKIKVGQFNLENVREAKLAFDKLNISLEDLKSKNPREIFAEVAEKISNIKDPAEKTALAFDLFGRQGAAILPALKEFGELAEDFERIGGALNDIDFERFTSLEKSFTRLKAASGSLSKTLLVPFVELQKAFNNVTADIRGGMSKALAPIASMIADLTKPLAVVIEVFGRVVNIVLRVVGVVAQLVAAVLDLATLSEVFEAVGAAIKKVLGYLETMVSFAEKIAGAYANFLRPAIGSIASFMVAIISSLAVFKLFQLEMFKTAVTAVWTAAATKLAWLGEVAVAIVAAVGIIVVILGVLIGWFVIAAASAIASAAAIHIAWLVALGPLGLVIGAVELLAAGFVAIYALGGSVIGFFKGLGESIGLIGSETKEIDAATASVEEIGRAAEEVNTKGLRKDLEALGYSAEEIDAEFEKIRSTVEGFTGIDLVGKIFGTKKAPKADEIAASVKEARSEMDELTISAAKYGQAGSDAANKSVKEFNDLQQKLAKGDITLEEFNESAKRNAKSLEDNLQAAKDGSPLENLKKNLELYKQLDDAAKEARKSVRDIGAGMVVEGKFFPASDEVKARAAEYKNAYIAALEEIKKKQQSGGFEKELKAKAEKNEADFKSGKISKEQYESVKLELDSTNAQEQASIAGEEAKREFDRNFKKIGEDVSFAENIRKELENAFLSPVDKFDKELKKIKNNPELNFVEKQLAEFNLRKQTREQLVGKSAQSQFQERSRDIRQAAESGLINPDEMNAELKKAAEDFASAVGVTKTPFQTFSSSLDNIAKQFGFAGQPIDVVREKLKGNAEQLALFDQAVKESRDNLLSSLGIEKSPQAVFEEQMKKISEAENATDPNKKITKEQAEQARAVATRKRDEALGAGADLGGQFRERQAKIAEAYGPNGEKDPAKFAAAQNKLDMDRRSAAGLDATAGQQLKAGVDKINDAFGVTGKSMAEIQKELTPEEFKEYQEALKKNSDAVKANLGVEKTGAEKIAESREKLQKAVDDGAISGKEMDKVLKDQHDALASSLGISKSPAEEFEQAVDKIKENASELSPDEIAKGLKEAKDKLLASLGIEKSPAQQASESMEKLTEAFHKGQISADEFAKGAQKAHDSLLQSLGIPLDPITQLREKMDNLKEAFNKGLISTEEYARGQEEAKKSLLPGGEEESPVKKFQRDLETLQRASQERLISPEEFNQRKLNLQAQLQEELKPALEANAPDRRGVEGADVRSKSGVDTFFRILRGNDNPSLKAQLEVARNTKILADASKNPDAAPVIAQLPAPR
jgi:hypothetical protein